jgi:hypothetical protein
MDLSAGEYRFRVRVDDGARLWVNNRLIINEWRTQPDATFTGEITLPGGQIPVALEYYEEGGAALIQLSWERIGGPPSGSNRWRGEYFNNRSLSGAPALVREDRAIDFNWGIGSPAPSVVANDNFSARWTIMLNFSGGRYRFTTETDGGVRLYIDDQLVIDQWRTLTQTRYNDEVDLSRGDQQLRMEYFEQGGGAVARLGWRRIGDAPTSRSNVLAGVSHQPASYDKIHVVFAPVTVFSTPAGVPPSGQTSALGANVAATSRTTSFRAGHSAHWAVGVPMPAGSRRPLFPAAYPGAL